VFKISLLFTMIFFRRSVQVTANNTLTLPTVELLPCFI